MAEEKKEEKTSDKQPVKAAVTPSIWIFSTVILAVALVVSVVGSGITGNFLANSGNGNAVAEKAVTYINDNLLSAGNTANLINVSESNGMYLMNFIVGNNTYTAYVTKDGNMLFLKDYAIDLTKSVNNSVAQTTTFDATDSAKPDVKLFVMSFCPFGKNAESNATMQVFNAMGDKVSIEPHFIISVMNQTEAENYVKMINAYYNKTYTLKDMNFLVIGDNYLKSLHGPAEATEDIRQALIFKTDGPAAFWKYVNYVNYNCSISNIDTCWKAAATATGIDSAAIESKISTDGIAIMRADQTLTDTYSVSGSPTLLVNGETLPIDGKTTLVINGNTYAPDGQVTPDAYKDAMCTGFSTQPAECKQVIGGASSSPTGGCG